MTFILGLTGGIGSGKSAATKQFATLGIDIIDADMISREVVEPGAPALESIAEHFGPGIVLPSGDLDRVLLREKIFSDVSAKQWLEALLHPLIRETIIQRLEAVSSLYGILVSPLLFETQQHQLAHRTLVIDCNAALQEQRALQRDGVSLEQIKTIMQSQLPRAQRCQQADDIIENNGTLEQLHIAINHYHKQLLTTIDADYEH